MTETSSPASAPGILTVPKYVRNAVERGQKYVCTYSNGTVCLGRWSVAWCISCRMPRCEKHVIHGKCATCNTSVVTFESIRGAVA
jgi:hypothetical protein